MPTLLRWNGYRFYFFSNEGYEPPHVHIDRDECSAKFWLSPVALGRNYGFNDSEIRVLSNKVIQEQQRFLEAWHAFFP